MMIPETTRTAFWNNKGGTGKTSLAFQAICAYADKYPDKNILVFDVCPRAKLSELLLGGLEGGGSDNLDKVQEKLPRATIGGYFESRFSTPYEASEIQPVDYCSKPCEYNSKIPENITLVAGDPLLELQANAMFSMANTSIPGTNAWEGIIKWLRDFIDATGNEFDAVFMDINPSFSIYTQIALAAVDRMVLPIMVDDSSRRAILNVFQLIYELEPPPPSSSSSSSSETYKKYMFKTRMENSELALPKVHLIVENQATPYVDKATKGYRAAVIDSVKNYLEQRMKAHDALKFTTFGDINDGIIEVRDFQTPGVVSFAHGIPFFNMEGKEKTVAGKRLRVNEANLKNMVEAINALVEKL